MFTQTVSICSDNYFLVRIACVSFVAEHQMTQSTLQGITGRYNNRRNTNRLTVGINLEWNGKME